MYADTHMCFFSLILTTPWLSFPATSFVLEYSVVVCIDREMQNRF